MRIRTLLGIGAVLSAASLMCLVSSGSRADDVKLFGESADVKKLTAADIGELQKTLGAAKVEKKDVKRAKVLAVVIGLNAQALGNMAMHEQAGKVLQALKDDKPADALKAAGGLSGAAGNGKATDLVKYLFDDDTKEWDHDLTMQLFKTPRAGGLGIDSKIKNATTGDFFQLTALITAALAEPWNLPRNVKKEFTKLRDLGNRSAHNRYYLAKKPDIDALLGVYRETVEAFLHLAKLL